MMPNSHSSLTRKVFVTPLRVALAYLVFGLGWIFATDLALVALEDPGGVILWASLCNGTLFVIVSATVVYLLVWREVREQIRTAKLLQAVVEGTTDAVFVKDRQGVYLFCNTAAAQLVARTPAEVIGHTDADWFDSSSYQLIRKREMQVMQQGQATTAEETLTAGGVTRTFHAVKAPYRDADGNILGVVGISRGISERAKLMARIREQESLLREAGELARIGGWAFAPDSDQGQWTDVVAQILEVDYQTFQLAQFLQFLSGDSRARFEATLQAARQGGLTFDLELQVQTARGASLWVRMIGKAGREEGHPLLIRGCIQDITAQKKLQQELRDNEARIRTLGDNLPDGGLYRYRRWPDDRKIFEFVSRGIEQIFGVTATELQQDALALHRLIDPEDAIRLDAAERESMANQSVFDCEFRSWTRSGQLRWFHCRSSPTPQPDGSTVWDGVITDITARRLAENRLRQLSVAVEQCPVSIVITDPTGAIEYVNPVFTEITGYSPDEVIGRNPRLLKSGLMSETFYQDMWANLVAGRTWRGEIINRRKNGSLYWESVSISPLRDAAGRITHYVGVKEDITERKRAEIKLHAVLAEAQRLRSALDQVPSLIYIKDTQSRYIYANRLTLELFGCTQETLAGRTDDDFFPPDVAQRLRAIDARVLAGEQTTEEIVVDYPHKKTIYLELKAPIFMDANRSEPFGLVGVSMDITANKEAEAALRASEQRYRGLIESMPALMWVYEGESSPGLYNTRWIEYTGHMPGKPLAEILQESIHPDDFPRALQQWEQSRTTGQPYECEYRLRRADGVYRWFLAQGNPMPGPASLEQWVGLCTDIDAQKRAEQALQVRNDLYAMLSRTNRAVSRCRFADELFQEVCEIAVEIGRFRFACVWVPNGDRMQCIASAGDDRGYLQEIVISLDEADPRSHGPVGQAFLTGRSYIVNDFLSSTMTVPWQETAKRAGFGAAATFPLRERGRVVAVLTLYAAQPGFFTEELVQTLLEISPSISFALDAFVQERERKRDEAELRMRDRALNATSQGIVITDPFLDGQPIVFASSSFERLTGYSSAEVIGRSLSLLQGQDTDPAALTQIQQAIANQQHCLVELLHYRKDGTPFWNALAVSPVRDTNNQLTHYVYVLTDVTERRRLEEQYRQAQKMEAIGQLAGGVAHDFNNLLTVINGYSELLIARSDPDDPTRHLLVEISKAGERASTLTRQLLAFSRKQMLEMKIVNLNGIVGDTEKMLRRMIGEDVTLHTQLQPDLHLIRADPGQMAQILINLAVNARDAMPTGGHLTIETHNIVLGAHACLDLPEIIAGDYVLLSIADTGCGMDDSVKAHIFEPFFTTKGVGKGTGLGLATVHGIVKQSGGHIAFESRPGSGTTFRIYLPAMTESASDVPNVPTADELPRGHETILLAEDEPTVRLLARRILESCGYTLLEATNGLDALRLVEQYDGPIHLLLTDVVMPNMSGRELAQRILRKYPECRLLFVSGYTDDAILRYGVEVQDYAFLQKPFNPVSLSRKVRSILDQKK